MFGAKQEKLLHSCGLGLPDSQHEYEIATHAINSHVWNVAGGC
jgi:hypothetical protein